MSRLELLRGRGFRDEKHLNEFLENCADESWKAELVEYFGIEEKPKKSRNKKTEESDEVKADLIDNTQDDSADTQTDSDSEEENSNENSDKEGSNEEGSDEVKEEK